MRMRIYIHFDFYFSIFLHIWWDQIKIRVSLWRPSKIILKYGNKKNVTIQLSLQLLID